MNKNVFKTKEIKPRNRWHLDIQIKFPARISKNKKKEMNKYKCREH